MDFTKEIFNATEMRNTEKTIQTEVNNALLRSYVEQEAYCALWFLEHDYGEEVVANLIEDLQKKGFTCSFSKRSDLLRIEW